MIKDLIGIYVGTLINNRYHVLDDGAILARLTESCIMLVEVKV